MGLAKFKTKLYFNDLWKFEARNQHSCFRMFLEKNYLASFDLVFF